MIRPRSITPLRTTIVVPCYNEAERLDVEQFASFARAHREVSFLFVDDGSTDGTPEVLQRLTERLSEHCDALHLASNCGKAEAVRRGVLQAHADGADIIGYFDADLATPLQALCGMIDILERRIEIQLVMGSRIRLQGHQIDRKATRRLLGRSFALVASWALGLAVVDTQCGAKLFRTTPPMMAVFDQPFRSRWIFDVEILARLCQALGRKQTAEQLYELPLEAWREVPGSKLKSSDFLKAVGELAGNVWQYRIRGSRGQDSGSTVPEGGTAESNPTAISPPTASDRAA